MDLNRVLDAERAESSPFYRVLHPERGKTGVDAEIIKVLQHDLGDLDVFRQQIADFVLPELIERLHRIARGDASSDLADQHGAPSDERVERGHQGKIRGSRAVLGVRP